MASLIRSTALSVAPCSSRHHVHNRRRLLPCFATNDNQQQQASDTSSEASAAAAEEARIEALEASLRKAKAKGTAKRQIPIRNMTPKQQEANSTRAEWKAGQLFPEGWQQMSPAEKITELYLGQRGILYWANQAAWWSVWIVGGAWVLFRFVGPAVGLYQLQGDLSPPAL